MPQRLRSGSGSNSDSDSGAATATAAAASTISYLVPSLLPPVPPAFPAVTATGADTPCFYLVFQPMGRLYAMSSKRRPPANVRRLDAADFDRGFLPDGLFTRLLAKVVGWSQQTGGGGAHLNEYYAGYADVHFCSDAGLEGLRFEMRVLRAGAHGLASVVRVRVFQAVASPIVATLCALLDDIRDECMPELRYHVAVAVPEATERLTSLVGATVRGTRGSLAAASTAIGGRPAAPRPHRSSACTVCRR